MTTLSTLPNEILSLITSHFDRPRDLLSLSLTSHRLADFAKLDGWKALLKGRFGVGGLDLDAANAVHGLTTLCRNWDRKGFVARYLEPTKHTRSINTWKPAPWRGSQGQTMGYQPSIDSYEETFGAWGERREVLAWSAGTQVVMRVKETGARGKVTWEKERESEAEAEQTVKYDAFKHANSWFSYKIPESVEGRDDITSLRLLRPYQTCEDSEDLIFGTASGHLSRLTICQDRKETLEQKFNTTRRAVGSTSISPSSDPLLAATLGDSSLALFPVNGTSPDLVEPIAQVALLMTGPRTSRIWSCSFLSDDKVAIGIGPSSEPIQIYQITADGFLSEPLRSFNLDPTSWTSTSSSTTPQRNTSVYPLLPLDGTTAGGSDSGSIFLSGGYDGIVRLHDTRSPHDFDSLFWDPTNDSSIYSLAAHGRSRLLAGVSMHAMLKVFDLRLSGSRAYHAITPPVLALAPSRKSQTRDFASNATVAAAKRTAVTTLSGGWNIYLHPRAAPLRTAYREEYWRGRDDSPVYAVAVPSAQSSSVYAGLEGAVIGLSFHGVADKHRDGMFTGAEAGDQQVLNLGMYEQGDEDGLGMQLLVQRSVEATVEKGEKEGGLDERWCDVREEERWERGAQQGRRGGRGRGRGRRRGRGA